MLKLTISPDEQPIIQTFDKKLVTIGSGAEPVDISLPDAELQSLHLKIIDEGNRILVINAANDPFATLNNLPFGKKTLNDKDILQVGHYTILFEIEEQEPPTLEATLENLIENVSSPLELTEQKPSVYVPLIEHYAKQGDRLDLDAPLHGAAPLNPDSIELIPEKPAYTPFSYEKEIPASSETFHKFVTHIEPAIDKIDTDTDENNVVPQKKHLDFEVGEFDDESENWINDRDDKVTPPGIPEEKLSLFSWKFISTILLAFLLICSLISGALYFNKSAKNEGEEIEAAEGVADIAMALKYAQIQHIKPHQKNWSDPEFIKNSLAHVIPHDYPSLANIDSEGHINHTSYSLRIYTSTDFSRFLVIAQPAPSLLQSLIPKTAIVIDSKLMQLRKVVDMKTLNRLLVNSNNLDNSNAIEVTNLVKNGELIPLSVLAQKRKGHDFSPPKALSLIRPGAENYIYNAPRYYQLGETIMKRAIGLMEMTNSPYELSRLKQEVSLLAKMQDLVLYSADGMEASLQMQKAIAAFASNGHFLTAFLKINTHGLIVGSHLVIEDESTHHQPLETNTGTKLPIAKEPPSPVVQAKPIATPVEQESLTPLQLGLHTLREERKAALIPVKNEIIALLNEDASYPVDGIDTRVSHLLAQYFEMDKKQKQMMSHSILAYSQEYHAMPIHEFLDNLDSTGLKEGSKEILSYVIQNEKVDDKIETFLNQLGNSENFVQLNENLSKALKWLVIGNFVDLSQLQHFQNEMKSQALNRVNELLFSSKPVPLSLTFNTEQRNALQQILQSTWLKDPLEQAYYLDEFERMKD
jgi:hypothetical protein